MQILTKIKLKKYQTQNFVNQYLQKKNRIYYKRLRKEALLTLQKESFTKFEYRYILTEYWTVSVGRCIEKNFSYYKKKELQEKYFNLPFPGNTMAKNWYAPSLEESENQILKLRIQINNHQNKYFSQTKKEC